MFLWITAGVTQSEYPIPRHDLSTRFSHAIERNCSISSCSPLTPALPVSMRRGLPSRMFAGTV